MKIIISPAKKLTSKNISKRNGSIIQFRDEATCLVKILRSCTVNDLKKMMSLSDNLANLNYSRYQKWDLKSKEIIPAIYMFQGDVYKGLKADQLLEDELDFAQENLRIISGLYGLLKPLDLIFPYRLEMGTKLKTEIGNNLYEFWGNKLNKALSYDMQDKEVLINLASQEYSKAVQMERLKHPIITPIFKDYKNGKLKVISFFAKKARGEMGSFIIKNKITDSDDLKLFANDGYRFTDESNGELLFTR